MSVIKIKHLHRFVSLSCETIENSNLSFKAKGLWAYCMSKPHDWEFHVSHLATVSKDGEDAIYSAINELIEEGYCRRVQTNINGKFGRVDLEMYQESIKLKKCLPQTVFPDAGFPDTENPALLNIDPIPTIEKRDKKPASSKPLLKKQVDNEKKERAPYVFTSDREHESLVLKTGGADKAIRCYQKLSEWKIAKPEYQPKSDYLAILKWVVKASSNEVLAPNHEEIVKFIEQEFSHRIGKDIIIGYNYIEFPYVLEAHFKYEENGFIDKVISSLRKMNLPVHGLMQKFAIRRAA